ncbi:MAG TPA: HD domain-containing protein [Streptosporangiaceae bacterium]|nr:HD domain-containing protein [Streptosporangiaceae bacterium]
MDQQQATDEFIGSTPVSSWHGDRLTDDTTGFLYEIGLLKRYPRTGWALAGVPAAESVAEHSFRASIIAATLAAAEDADPQRAAFLALWHDTQETRTTDLPHLTRRYVTTASNETVTGDQVRPLPPAFAAMISGAASEALTQNSLEWLKHAQRA